MTASNESSLLNVLIVEDDLDAQANLQDILELEGYRSESALCAADVLARGSLDQFDVILLDRKLPDSDGDGLLPYFREKAPAAAVIVITGDANIEAAVTALRHGATDFLTKPIEPEVLRARLRHIAEQRRMREQLADAQRRLIQSERLAAIGQTIAALSHEARNELHGLGLGLQLLPKVIGEPASARKIVSSMIRNQHRLTRLFEDVRGFAAPIQLARSRCDLGEIWRNAWQSLEAGRQDRDVSLEEAVGPEDLEITGDAFRLEQVFRNLFENSLAACSDPVNILVTAEVDAGPPASITLTVSDNGPGLSPEQQERIFQPFFTTKSHGTGLGMAITARIMDAHGGSIRVDAGSGGLGGARFVITVPCDSRRAAAELESRLQPALPSRR